MSNLDVTGITLRTFMANIKGLYKLTFLKPVVEAVIIKALLPQIWNTFSIICANCKSDKCTKLLVLDTVVNLVF